MRFTGHNDIVVQYGNPSNACFNPPKTCASALGPNWGGPGGRRGALFAGSFMAHGRKHGFLAGSRIETSSSGESVTVRGKDQPGAKGSATLVSVGAAKTRQRKCDGGTVSEQTWNASYSNGPKPLTLSEDFGSGFVQRNSKRGADISIATAGVQPASMSALRPATARPRAIRQLEIRRATLAQWRAQR